MATVALFSASKQALCTLVVCHSEGVTVAFTQRVLNLHESGCSAVLIVTWLARHKMAAVSAQVLCTPNSMHQFTVSLFKAAYIGCMCV